MNKKDNRQRDNILFISTFVAFLAIIVIGIPKIINSNPERFPTLYALSNNNTGLNFPHNHNFVKSNQICDALELNERARKETMTFLPFGGLITAIEDGLFGKQQRNSSCENPTRRVATPSYPGAALKERNVPVSRHYARAFSRPSALDPTFCPCLAS